MFTRIAGRYDLMNGVDDRRPPSRLAPDRHRRRRAGARRPPRSTWPPAPATSPSPCAPPIRDASWWAPTSRRRCCVTPTPSAPRGGERGIALLAADALALPFADRTFACVVSAFLLRNLADLAAGLAEMRRVTRPGGLVAALEITRPRAARLGRDVRRCTSTASCR